MEGNNISIENLEGLKTSYTPTYYYNYPFSMKISDDFSHENCVCIAVTRFDNQYTGMYLIGYKIEFLKQVDRNTYRDKLNINGFNCYGLALIQTTEEESIDIIKDLKSNSKFYVEKASDLI